ncbi:unnamed protein product [Gadus morhua 'NCC']
MTSTAVRPETSHNIKFLAIVQEKHIFLGSWLTSLYLMLINSLTHPLCLPACIFVLPLCSQPVQREAIRYEPIPELSCWELLFVCPVLTAALAALFVLINSTVFANGLPQETQVLVCFFMACCC